MKKLNLIFTISMLTVFSMTTLASHDDLSLENKQYKSRNVRIEQINFDTQRKDGATIITGKVRRVNRQTPVPQGHVDLIVYTMDGKVILKDSEYYWPRTVNRRYRLPSRFSFAINEKLPAGSRMEIIFHKEEVPVLPKPHQG